MAEETWAPASFNTNCYGLYGGTPDDYNLEGYEYHCDYCHTIPWATYTPPVVAAANAANMSEDFAFNPTLANVGEVWTLTRTYTKLATAVSGVEPADTWSDTITIRVFDVTGGASYCPEDVVLVDFTRITQMGNTKILKADDIWEFTIEYAIDSAYSAYASDCGTTATIALIGLEDVPATGSIAMTDATTLRVTAPTYGSADHYAWGI